MSTFRFWILVLKRARLGAASYANDWQWVFGAPAVAAFAGAFVASDKGMTTVTTGNSILDAFLAALAAFIVTWLIAFGINLIKAPAQLLREEQEKTAKLAKENEQFLAKSLPSLEGEILQLIIGLWDLSPTVTAVSFTFNLAIRNSGAPTIVDGYRIRVIHEDKATYATLMVFPEEKLVMQAAEPTTPAFILRRADAIFEKTTSPIPAGGKVSGWIIGTVTGRTYDELTSSGTKVIVEFQDINRKNHQITQEVESPSDAFPKYFPDGTGGINFVRKE